MRALRRSRCHIAAFGILLLLACAPGLCSGLAPLTCPPGSEPDRQTSSGQPAQVESCRNRKTGLREGPFREFGRDGRVAAEGTRHDDQLDGEFRAYDAQGRLTYVFQYSKGTQVGVRLTAAGMDDMVQRQNALAVKNGLKVKWVARDEHSVVMIVTTRAPLDRFDGESMHARLLGDPRNCAPFKAADNLQTLYARFVDPQEKELLVVPIRRTDCRM